ncbi:GntR family transcriptional regulator, partial [Microbacterium sp.]|uniref:GntR family transcriptional regulator n=1 Tax=Microbacterium sp. TaxID=51671 RepID=UPI003A83DF94
RAASLDEAAALAVAPASRVHEVHRVRTLDGVPACYDITVLPLGRFPGVDGAALEDASLYAVLEGGHDVRIVRTDYAIRADAAPSDVAVALGISEHDPVLVGEETAFDLAGGPVLLGRETYRHDAYEFQATLWRSYEGGTP